MSARVEVQFATDVNTELTTTDIGTWVSRVMEANDWQGSKEICVRVVDRAEMQAINRSYRGKNAATNVLSFPGAPSDGLPPDTDVALGDLVICAPVVSDEAAKQGKTLRDHWIHMVVHGTLHLMGFDHENDDEAAAMERREIQVLADFGVDNPYWESPSET